MYLTTGNLISNPLFNCIEGKALAVAWDWGKLLHSGQADHTCNRTPGEFFAPYWC
jgi:hypothetical protein